MCILSGGTVTAVMLWLKLEAPESMPTNTGICLIIQGDTEPVFFIWSFPC